MSQANSNPLPTTTFEVKIKSTDDKKRMKQALRCRCCMTGKFVDIMYKCGHPICSHCWELYKPTVCWEPSCKKPIIESMQLIYDVRQLD